MENKTLNKIFSNKILKEDINFIYNNHKSKKNSKTKLFYLLVIMVF